MSTTQAYAQFEPQQESDIVVPEALIYEMVKGQPIYYAGWREVLTGEKTLEQVMASSLIQSYLVYEIGVAVSPLRKKYIIGTNEAGLKFDKGDWRAADIALWTKESMKEETLNPRYTGIVPEIVIEVDTKADTTTIPDYYIDKTKHLHEKGVQRVIWFYSYNEKVMVAQKGQKWEIQDWSESVEIADGVFVNAKEIIDNFQNGE
jgi:Uma2 family endonuclease